MVTSSKVSFLIALALGCGHASAMALAFDQSQQAVARSNSNQNYPTKVSTLRRRDETFDTTDSPLTSDKQPDSGTITPTVVQGPPLTASEFAALVAEEQVEATAEAAASKKVRRNVIASKQPGLAAANRPRNLVGAFQRTAVGDFKTDCQSPLGIFGPFSSVTFVQGTGNDGLSGQPMIASMSFVELNGETINIGQGAPAGDAVTLTLAENEYFTSGSIQTVNNGQTPARVQLQTSQGRSISSSPFDNNPTVAIDTGSGLFGTITSCQDSHGNLNSLDFGFVDAISALEIIDIVYTDPTSNSGAALGLTSQVTPISSATISVGRQISNNTNFSLGTTVQIQTVEKVIKTNSLADTFNVGLESTTAVKVSGGVDVPFVASGQGEASTNVKISFSDSSVLTSTTVTETSESKTYDVSCPAFALCIFDVQYITYSAKFDCVFRYKATVGNGATVIWEQPGTYSITDTPGLIITNTERSGNALIVSG